MYEALGVIYSKVQQWYVVFEVIRIDIIGEGITFVIKFNIESYITGWITNLHDRSILRT